MSRRSLGLLVGLAVLTGSLSACGGEGTTGQNIAAIDVPAQKVSSVTFTAGAKSATFQGRDGVFRPGAGATAESATLLNTSDVTFPVNAYRILDGVDANTPDFGLVANSTGSAPGPTGPPKECGTGCSMSVTSTDGATHKLSVGAQTFNFAGYYGKVDGDPRVFLLISATVAQIISMARGRPFEFPKTEQELKLDATTARLADEAKGVGAPEANYDPMLRQVLAAEQDRKAAQQGRPGGALLRAATSTQDQLGSANDQQASASPAPKAQQSQGQQ